MYRNALCPISPIVTGVDAGGAKHTRDFRGGLGLSVLASREGEIGVGRDERHRQGETIAGP